jgi:Acetyltransferase (GNAT) domain
VKLECGRCVLRFWSEGDAPSLVRCANNYEVWRRLRDRFPHPYTQAGAEQWIAFAQQQDHQTQFATEVHGEEVAGGITLELGSDIERCSAEIGYWLGEAFWGRDYHGRRTCSDQLRVRSIQPYMCLCRSFCEQYCVDTSLGEMWLRS